MRATSLVTSGNWPPPPLGRGGDIAFGNRRPRAGLSRAPVERHIANMNPARNQPETYAGQVAITGNSALNRGDGCAGDHGRWFRKTRKAGLAGPLLMACSMCYECPRPARPEHR